MRHLTYANVMATVAVFVALGGGAYAAVHVNGKNIQNRTIAGKKLKNNTLGAKQINERRLGQVPRAKSADVATSATTATRAATAETATSATSATTATRATTADNATTATSATSATNAGDAATLDGYVPGDFLVDCTAATSLYGGVCWDNTARAAANWFAASDTCGNAGGRLPTLSELIAYVDQPGAQVGASHWSSDVTDEVAGNPGNPVVAVRNESTTSFAPGGGSFEYRCVFYRTND